MPLFCIKLLKLLLHVIRASRKEVGGEGVVPKEPTSLIEPNSADLLNGYLHGLSTYIIEILFKTGEKFCSSTIFLHRYVEWDVLILVRFIEFWLLWAKLNFPRFACFSINYLLRPNGSSQWAFPFPFFLLAGISGQCINDFFLFNLYPCASTPE